MIKTFIVLVFLIIIGCNSPIAQTEPPVTLEDCDCWEDTVYVLDYWSYSDNGNLKPPCSMSPEYENCIQSRYKKLKGSEL